MAMKRLLTNALFKRSHTLTKGSIKTCNYHDNSKYKNIKALGKHHIKQ